MLALVIVTTATAASLLVVYFDWRARMRRQIRAIDDA